MQQIADWLENAWHVRVRGVLCRNDIDTSVLRDLTDQDLKELGVSLGHRRKMLRAIAEIAVSLRHRHSLRRPSRSPKTLPSAAKSR